MKTGLSPLYDIEMLIKFCGGGGGGGGQPHFTSFYLIPILPFLAARMR